MHSNQICKVGRAYDLSLQPRILLAIQRLPPVSGTIMLSNIPIDYDDAHSRDEELEGVRH